MTIIPVWREREIRQKIEDHPEISNRDIAEMFEVSKDTVAEIRKSPGIRPRTPPGVRDKLKNKKRCPKCGGMLETWPCVLCRPWAYWYDEEGEEFYPEEQEQFNGTKKAA